MARLAASALLLMTVSIPATAADYAWPVVRVVDGDTVAVDASADLPAELADLRVRLRGVDTPEKGGRVVADLVLDGHSLSESLIAAGHGRAYDGGKRGSWCAQAESREQ